MFTNPLAKFLWSHALMIVAALSYAQAGLRADGLTGDEVYKQKCATCHGLTGEGSKEKYPRRLEGDRSVAQLAKLIAKTMPEDNPGTLAADEADKVAGYIHDAFYSRIARERNRPARVEMTRLTVKQYRNAVADLIGSFQGAATWGEERGLRGEYFNGRDFRNDRRALERRDPEVCFDFATASPDFAKIDAAEFTIRWMGSVLAPETGEYEFIVKTDHAVRLWVNDNKQPLIDAWVKSGKDTRYQASLYLVAGRAYPLRLEFTKAKQGVNDMKKAQFAPASITLAWKPPYGVETTIPARLLSPNFVPEAYIVATPFPPDDRSYGWERGSTISKAWDQATTDAALATASYVAAHLSELTGVRDDAADRDRKSREFCLRFAERGFRRPLTPEQKATYVDHQFDAAKDVETAVKRVVLLVLKSPRFLYREMGQGGDSYEVASRLSFGLWDSLPDQSLLDAAARGQLKTREQLTRQAERMLPDLRTRAKLRDFLFQWLKVEQPPDLAKDPMRYPGFDPALVANLRTSLDLFLEDIVWSDASDFRRLLLSDEVPLNGSLAKYYGAKLPSHMADQIAEGLADLYGVRPPAEPQFQKVQLNPAQRAGILTHPYLMACFAYTGESSPIHRGVFLARGVLGRGLRPPPEAVAPLPPDLHPSLTTRERVMLQTKAQNCMTCHGMINPLGFTLEHFDAVGRYRDQDKGKPIDASGSYLLDTGKTVQFGGARDLGVFLANDSEVHAAFAEQLFHHLVKQSIRAYGTDEREALRKYFAANGFNIRKLAVEIVTTASTPPGKTEAQIPKTDSNSRAESTKGASQ
jgi:hypothetical protein